MKIICQRIIYFYYKMSLFLSNNPLIFLVLLEMIRICACRGAFHTVLFSTNNSTDTFLSYSKESFKEV